MFKSRILKLAIAVIFVAGPATGLAAVGSGTALAATAAASQAVTPTVAQVAALNQCPIILHRFTTYAPTCADVTGERLCFSGNEANFTVLPDYAANGCIYRVWLYSGDGETGSTLCLSPTSSTMQLAQAKWKSFRIVSNQNNC
jgi:hypothetical protein